jgi:hypothetical protein
MAEVKRRQLVLWACGSVASMVALSRWKAGGSGSPTRGRGAWTGFGTVAVLSTSSRVAALLGGHAGHGDASGRPLGEDELRLDVEVHNGLAAPVLFSPGQFRLRLDGGGTVTPFDVGSPPGPVAPGSTTRTWVSYLVPRGARGYEVEFTEAGPSQMVRVPTVAPLLHRHEEES